MSVKITTGLVRFSYAYVWQPKEDDNGNVKYRAMLLIPKQNKASIQRIVDAIDQAIQEGIENGTFGKKKPGTWKKKNTRLSYFKWLLQDGDEKEDDEANLDPNLAGMYYLNASSKEAPLLADEDRNEIVDEQDFYSGCWGRAQLRLYAFDKKGNIGIGAALNSCQKLRDGERLSGRDSIETAFSEELEEDEFDVLGEFGDSEEGDAEEDVNDLLGL